MCFDTGVRGLGEVNGGFLLGVLFGPKDILLEMFVSVLLFGVLLLTKVI